MNKPLYLLVGKSASGKTTVANALKTECAMSQLQSYTTRPKRFDEEVGHIFITDEEFNKLQNIMAYTEYNKYRYCATKEQVDATDIYVIDVPGVETLLQKYQTDRPIIVIYFQTNIRTRIDRMIDRHDSDMEIVSRIYNDEEFDWELRLDRVVWNNKYNLGRNITMYTIDANKNLDSVVAQIKFLIN